MFLRWRRRERFKVWRQFSKWKQKEKHVTIKRTSISRYKSMISGNGTLLYFRRRNFLILQDTELLYTSGNGTFLHFRKRKFFIFWERTISYLFIFRTRSIFRTLSNIYNGKFPSLIFQEVTFRVGKMKKNKNTLKKFLIFRGNGTF